jgi:cell division protein FtsB
MDRVQMEMISMRNLVAGCASLALFAGSLFAAPATFADDAARIEQLEAEIAALKEKNRQLDLRIESLENLAAGQSSVED